MDNNFQLSTTKYKKHKKHDTTHKRYHYPFQKHR